MALLPLDDRLPTPTFGPVGCEDNTAVTYSMVPTCACLGVRDIGCGISPVGGNVPCFGISVARHDPFVVHAIDGDQLHCGPRATSARFQLPVVQYCMMNQLRDSGVRGVIWGLSVRISLHAGTSDGNNNFGPGCHVSV